MDKRDFQLSTEHKDFKQLEAFSHDIRMWDAEFSSLSKVIPKYVNCFEKFTNFSFQVFLIIMFDFGILLGDLLWGEIIAWVLSKCELIFQLYLW